MMKYGVVATRHQHEVLPAIIRLVPVDVMNNLGTEERPSKPPLHHNPMLQALPVPADRDDDVAAGRTSLRVPPVSRPLRAIVLPATGMRTEAPSPGSQSRGVRIKVPATPQTPRFHDSTSFVEYNMNMHDGQFADIEAHNRNQNLLAVRYGEGAYNLPPSH